MKVLITGAAGFIGSQLAYRFWKIGAELVILDNFSYGKMDNLEFPDHSFKNEILRMDIRDKAGIENIFKPGDIDFVYNMAGIAPLPDCQLNPCEAIDVNVTGFVNLLENGRKYGVKKIIQASTNAMYENETEFPTRENNFKYPQSYCDTYGMSITCLRFANVYGPHIDCLRKQPPFVAYMIRELYYGRTPVFHSDGNQRRDYIYVDDLVNLGLAVQDTPGFDCVNVASNMNYSVNEMYEIAQKIMRKDIKAEYASDTHYWEKYPGLYEGAYPIKEEILNHEINKYSLCDNAHAKDLYGRSPKVSMEDGLKAVIENECELLTNLGDEK